jgi:hypothetical protein
MNTHLMTAVIAMPTMAQSIQEGKNAPSTVIDGTR